MNHWISKIQAAFIVSVLFAATAFIGWLLWDVGHWLFKLTTG